MGPHPESFVFFLLDLAEWTETYLAGRYKPRRQGRIVDGMKNILARILVNDGCVSL